MKSHKSVKIKRHKSGLTLISQQVGFLEKFHSKLKKFHSELENTQKYFAPPKIF